MTKYHKVAVIGGSGKAGKYLLKELVNRGYAVRVLLRQPDKLRFENVLIEKVKGDVTNYASVVELLKGCNAVISTLGQTKGEQAVHTAGTSNIIEAMNKLNIDRFVLLTGLSIDMPFDQKSFRTKLLSKLMKLSFPRIIADKQNEYKIISGSTLNWTVVRCPLIELTEGQRPIKTSLFDCPGKKISSADLACFLSDQLSVEDYCREAPFIAN